VVYSGDIARIRFEVLRDGDPGLAFGMVRLRDGDNREINARLKSSSGQVPAEYSLSQNYPNPFDHGTIIGYQVAKTQHVTLEVYNSLGAKIATLVDGVHNAGNYQVQLNTTSLSTGLYYYIMRAGSFTAMRPMALTR
jgi:hypothetical protein